MTAVIERLERATFRLCFLVCFVVLALVHANAIHDPPYWDTLTGAFTQAHWQATHSFSPFALLDGTPSFNEGGACVYPFSLYPVIVGALERWGASIAVTHVSLHVLSYAAGAAVLAALFQLARRAVGGGLAALATLACATLPLFRALTAQMNMDILVAAFTLLALLAASQRRYRTAVTWAAFALLVKPTGIIVVVALAGMLVLRRLRGAWFETTDDEPPRITSALWMLGGLGLVFALELVLAGRHGKLPPGVSLFGGTLPFLGKRLWTLPEFGLTLLALALAAPWIVKRARRGAAHPLEIDGLVFAAAFVGFYCQYQNVLPRYCAQAFPIVLVALVAAANARFSRRIVGTALALFALFGIVNAHGRFHPTKFADWSDPFDKRPLVANDGWLLERSLEYRDDLDLNRAIAAAAVDLRDDVVVAGWPLLQMLAEPRFGYVTTPPRLAASETALAWTAQKIESAASVRDRSPFVRLLSPNVYAGPEARVRDGDRVLATFERGRLRAYLLRRPSDSIDSRR
jgi:hypothetical protein